MTTTQQSDGVPNQSDSQRGDPRVQAPNPVIHLKKFYINTILIFISVFRIPVRQEDAGRIKEERGGFLLLKIDRRNVGQMQISNVLTKNF